MGKKDLRILESYEKKDFISLLAILPIRMSKEWILYPFSRVGKRESLEISLLSTKKEWRDLQKELQKKFEDLIKRYAFSIQKGGERFTLDLLKKYNLKQSGK